MNHIWEPQASDNQDLRLFVLSGVGTPLLGME